jgi:hypothetical protein
MPLYNIIHKNSKEELILDCKISELEMFMRDHPEWDVLCGTPGIHSGFRKTPDGFKDVLRQIKKNHRRSTIEV